MKYFFLIISFSIVSLSLKAQMYKAQFLIIDEYNKAIESASLKLNGNKVYKTNAAGKVEIITSGSIKVEVSHISYMKEDMKLTITSDTTIHMVLKTKAERIGEVIITGTPNKDETLNKQVISENSLRELQGNTLISKLEYLPGIASIDIGQGFSKPVIRGLSANRVAVTENGIKQQGQQWGMDHGLEIDPNSVEQVSVIKGPASLEYGSDAIGGVIAIMPKVRYDDGLEASAILNGRSNNDMLGTSLGIYYKKGKYFFKTRLSYQNYGDYRIPADSFKYLGWTNPIYEKRLKNTAGKDNSLLFAAGIKTGKIESSITLSNVYAKMGFFSGAHGIPGKSSLLPDGDSRNIDLPYQRVNHFKVISNNKIQDRNNNFFYIDLGYQFNHRQEYATPHSHGAKPLPTSSLELDLRLHTFTAGVKWKRYISEKINLSSGLSTEFQNNNIGGYSFLLPRFDQQSVGLYSLLNYNFKKDIVLQAGVRYDLGKIHVSEYTDDYIIEGFQRATELNKVFNNFSFNVGSSFRLSQQLDAKVNLGKSFRMPTANELAANGIHHGTFRYEAGDQNLKPETAYQTDASIEFVDDVFSLGFSSFATYFDNYIYLDPTGKYSIDLPGGGSIMLPDVGQIYKYKGGSTFRWGGEADVSIKVAKSLVLKSMAEYVYATDIENNYPIPFTPPFGLTNSITFTYKQLGKTIRGGEFSISYKYNASQNRIRNEEATPSSHLFDMVLKTNLFFSKKIDSKLIFGLNNILNTRYYNHISFYRYLDLPEAGRNATVTLIFNFK